MIGERLHRRLSRAITNIFSSNPETPLPKLPNQTPVNHIGVLITTTPLDNGFCRLTVLTRSSDQNRPQRAVSTHICTQPTARKSLSPKTLVTLNPLRPPQPLSDEELDQLPPETVDLYRGFIPLKPPPLTEADQLTFIKSD